MGSGKHDIRAFIIVFGIILICSYCALTSYSKDRESRNKTEAIQLEVEKPALSFEMPDDSMETLEEYIEKIKEGVLGEK